MADRCDAEADQIIDRQLWQNAGVDVVGGEGRRILFQAEPAQPVGDIDGHCASLSGYPWAQTLYPKPNILNRSGFAFEVRKLCRNHRDV
jgi:hypothetical protein